LDKTLRYFAKHLQGFPTHTRSDIALGMLGWTSAQSEIDRRKFMFLHRLCLTPNNVHTKRVFNVALFYFILSGCISSYGLISNLYYTLKKFDLLGYLTDYLHHSEIPDKQIWKEIVRSKIVGLENSLWRARMSNKADFDRFYSIHEYLRPASV
jgi:hypothetical protein